MTDPISFAFQRGFGGYLTPLIGKIPQLDAWQTLPPVDEATVREWAEDIGYNLGLRTGSGSGLFVIDDDQAKHGASGYVPPPTGLIAESPTGGRHYYYRAPSPCPGNSASRLAPHVDTRGEGGQVVYPGSSHPVKRTPYKWIATGEPGALPPETLDVLVPTPTKQDEIHIDTTQLRSAPAQDRYARAALLREVHAVRTAAEGTRNERLNAAAFSLAQLVAGGELDQAEVETELAAAAEIAGLDAREIPGTIRSGMKAGMQKPRRAPEQAAPRRDAAHSSQTKPTPAPVRTKPQILVPGSHLLPPDGDYIEQGTDQFCEQIIDALPEGSMYRRAEQVGEIHDAGFRGFDPDALRSIVDRDVRLGVGKMTQDGAGYTVAYRNCSADNARVIIAYAQTRGNVRELRFIASHPIIVGNDFRTAEVGWNDKDGVFLACEYVPDPLDVATARAVLEDLVCDFPFQATADRANFFGLMLTPLLRPALRAPVPMHLINSPVERSGKTKLAETVLGCSILGKPTAAMQLGEREEEREKRIMSTLMEGRTVLHLDNLTEFLNSASLASLLTSNNYLGRILGSTKNVSVENTLTIVATGNNVHATGEIAKRIVPIRLLPPTDSPETRQDYRHPILQDFVESERPRVLGALMGLIEAWRVAGRPLGPVGFGGFERWMAVVGGIMRNAGYEEWLGNLADWRGSADDFSEEVNALVKGWHDKWACEWVQASQVYELAVDLGLFGWLDKSKSDRGKKTSFGMRVLNRIRGRTMPGGLRVESDHVGEARRVRLARV